MWWGKRRWISLCTLFNAYTHSMHLNWSHNYAYRSVSGNNVHRICKLFTCSYLHLSFNNNFRHAKLTYPVVIQTCFSWAFNQCSWFKNISWLCLRNTLNHADEVAITWWAEAIWEILINVHNLHVRCQHCPWRKQHPPQVLIYIFCWLLEKSDRTDQWNRLLIWSGPMTFVFVKNVSYGL